jgi:ribosomal silencing factor RsfS
LTQSISLLDLVIKGIQDVKGENISILGLDDRPWHVEGKNNAEWILMDYSELVVHIFTEESRDFYALEDLWADAKIERIKELV